MSRLHVNRLHTESEVQWYLGDIETVCFSVRCQHTHSNVHVMVYTQTYRVGIDRHTYVHWLAFVCMAMVV